MDWKILLFETDRSEKPVENFIKTQNPPTVAKITHILDLLEKFGSFLTIPHSKKLASNLYELRIRGEQEVRILYSFINKKIYLLHAFRKQSQKTPKKELNTASERLKLLTTP